MVHMHAYVHIDEVQKFQHNNMKMCIRDEECQIH